MKNVYVIISITRYKIMCIYLTIYAMTDKAIHHTHDYNKLYYIIP